MDNPLSWVVDKGHVLLRFEVKDKELAMRRIGQWFCAKEPEDGLQMTDIVLHDKSRSADSLILKFRELIAEYERGE